MTATPAEVDTALWLVEAAKTLGPWVLVAGVGVYHGKGWYDAFLEHRRLMKRELNRHAEKMRKLEIDMTRQRPKLADKRGKKGGEDAKR